MFRLIPMAIVVSKLLKTISEPVQEAVEKTTANIAENENAEKIIKKRFKDTTVYLDSNIFMDFNYDNIFDYMIENKVKVTILKSQYDEMLNLRKKYNKSKTNQAKILMPQLTLALNRVEKLLDNTKSNIKDIGFNSDKNAYADIDFINAILKKLQKDKSVVFVTQDRDLRTRLKTMIKDDKKISKKNINIFKADEFIEYIGAIEILTNNKKNLSFTKLSKPSKNNVEERKIIEEIELFEKQQLQNKNEIINTSNKSVSDYFIKEKDETDLSDIIKAISNIIKKYD